MQKIQKQDIPPQFQAMIKQTEDNIEQILLPLHAMCPDDLPVIKWQGDEWQPDLLNDDIYPQFHRSDDFVIQDPGQRQVPADRYEVLWALPLCGRDQTKHWHDKMCLTDGTARYVLLFHYEFKVADGEHHMHSETIECFFGMYEGYRDTDRSVVSVYRNLHGNSIPVAIPLLVSMVKHVQDLHEHVAMEKQVTKVLKRMDMLAD